MDRLDGLPSASCAERPRPLAPTLGDVGFPDLVLAHPKRGVIFAELKSRVGKLSEAQERWIMTIRAAGGEAYVWRPADLQLIRTILSEDKP